MSKSLTPIGEWIDGLLRQLEGEKAYTARHAVVKRWVERRVHDETAALIREMKGQHDTLAASLAVAISERDLLKLVEACDKSHLKGNVSRLIELPVRASYKGDIQEGRIWRYIRDTNGEDFAFVQDNYTSDLVHRINRGHQPEDSNAQNASTPDGVDYHETR